MRRVICPLILILIISFVGTSYAKFSYELSESERGDVVEVISDFQNWVSDTYDYMNMDDQMAAIYHVIDNGWAIYRVFSEDNSLMNYLDQGTFRIPEELVWLTAGNYFNVSEDVFREYIASDHVAYADGAFSLPAIHDGHVNYSHEPVILQVLNIDGRYEIIYEDYRTEESYDGVVHEPEFNGIRRAVMEKREYEDKVYYSLFSIELVDGKDE